MINYLNSFKRCIWSTLQWTVQITLTICRSQNRSITAVFSQDMFSKWFIISPGFTACRTWHCEFGMSFVSTDYVPLECTMTGGLEMTKCAYNCCRHTGTSTAYLTNMLSARRNLWRRPISVVSNAISSHVIWIRTSPSIKLPTQTFIHIITQSNVNYKHVLHNINQAVANVPFSDCHQGKTYCQNNKESNSKQYSAISKINI